MKDRYGTVIQQNGFAMFSSAVIGHGLYVVHKMTGRGFMALLAYGQKSH